MPLSFLHDRHQTAAEAVIARSIAVFVVAMAAQSVGPVMRQVPELAPWWIALTGPTVVVSGLWVVISGLLGRNCRPALTVFALAPLGGLLLWPLAHPGAARGAPWVWYLLGLAIACTAAAWGQVWSLLYAGVSSVLFAAVRRLPAGGAGSWLTSLQDAVFLAITGLVLTAAIQAVRVGAARADAGAEAAAQAHLRSATARARLTERNRLAAILHDSVLAALVSAARAHGPDERRAAARLARESLLRLDDIGREAAGPTPLTQLPERLRSIAEESSTLPVQIYADLSAAHRDELPGPATEAILGAVQAALDNAGRHSGADRVEIRLALEGHARRVRIEVSDRGRGFDPQATPQDCLGIRLAIIQRMLSVGGSAAVDSAPGSGTTVVIGCGVGT